MDYTSARNPTDGENAFINELSKQDNGRLSQLRRNAGNTIAEARGVMWFYDLLNRFDSSRRYEETYFLVATLYATDKSEVKGNKGDLGTTLRMLKSASGASASESNPLDRRFNILLDADFDPNTGGELSFRLRQVVKLITSKKDPSVRINWPQLLHDLKAWQRSTRVAQKNWARSYYAPQLDNSQTNII